MFSSDEDDDDDGMIELVLDPSKNKTGDTWHICVQVVELLQTIHFCTLSFCLLTIHGCAIFYHHDRICLSRMYFTATVLMVLENGIKGIGLTVAFCFWIPTQS